MAFLIELPRQGHCTTWNPLELLLEKPFYKVDIYHPILNLVVHHIDQVCVRLYLVVPMIFGVDCILMESHNSQRPPILYAATITPRAFKPEQRDLKHAE